MRLTGRHHAWHPDNKRYAQVSCGNHKAKTCALCPGKNGREWCNGDCRWCFRTETCVPHDDHAKVCKGGSKSGKKERPPAAAAAAGAGKDGRGAVQKAEKQEV